MKKNYVAVFGLGPYQIYGLKKLKLRYKIIGFDENNISVGRKYVDHFYGIDTKNKKEILKICKSYKVKHIFCFSSDYAIDTILYLSKQLKLSSLKKYSAAKKASKKNLLKKIMLKNGIHIPKYSLISQNEIKKKINFKETKYIAKPTNLSGSRGVFTFRNKIELNKKLPIFQKYYNHKKLLIEEFINGKMYTIDGLFHKNNFLPFSLSIKTKKNSYSDKTVIVNYPDKNLIIESSELALSCCRALKSDDTLVHLEFIKCNKTGKLFVIDLGLRGAGTYVFGSLISKIISANTAQIEIDLETRKKFLSFKNNSICFYLYFVTADRNFFFKGINKVYLNQLNLKFYKILNIKKKNTMIKFTQSSYDRLALIIYKFDNYENLKKNISKLKKKLIDKKIILK